MATTKYSYNLFRRAPSQNQNPSEPDQNTAVAPIEVIDVEMEESLPVTSTLLATSPSSSSSSSLPSTSSVQRRPFKEALWKNLLFIWSPKSSGQNNEKSNGVDTIDGEPILKLPCSASSPDLLSSSSSATSTSTPHSKAYVELLERENARLKSFLQEILPAFQDQSQESDGLGSDSMTLEENFKLNVLTLYDTTIIDLKEQLKNLTQLMDDMQETHQKEKNVLIKMHNMALEEAQIKNEQDIARMARDNNALIDEILSKNLEDIEQWKREFERDTKMTLVQNGDNNSEGAAFVLDVDELLSRPKDNVAIQLYKQFSELGPVTQVLVVAGIGIIGLVFGYFSWPFVQWSMPRLLAFAARIELADVISLITWANTWAASREFQEFKQAWESGEPLGPLVFQKFGSEAISKILSLAPALFKKTRIPV